MKSGKKIFRPRARIIKSLGDELISNEFVAISELIKNSYDAGASLVSINIENDSITISDNGKGMSLEELQLGWFEPATNIKVKNNKVLGEKGIGRFAVVKLSSILELKTKSKNEECISCSFDWEEFNKEDSYLDEIKIQWSESDWNETNKTGTILVLKKLKDDWLDIKRLEKLEIFLSRMVSPFDDVKNFEIKIKKPGNTEFDTVEASDLLKKPHYLIKGSVSENYIEIDYKGLNERLKKEKIENLKDDSFCGDFEFEFRIWDRDVDVLKLLAENYSLKLNEIRELLDSVTGVSVYRDGFRVLPYGEKTDDWLRLDSRRVQNPTMKISNNQIIGYLKISKEKNSLLKDKTNREGLIENQTYKYFYTTVRNKILNFIEAERYLDREPKRKEIGDKKKSNDFSNIKSLDEVSDYASAKYPKDKELSGKIQDAKKETKATGEKFKKLVLRYRRLSTLGQLLETVIHEINNSFAKISAPLSIAKNYAGDNKKVIGKINEVIEKQKILQVYIDRLKPFAERTQDRSSLLDVKNEILRVFSIDNSILEENKIITEIKGSDSKILIKKVDLVSIIANLIDNSIYWLKEISVEDGRKISVEISENENSVIILFSDNGPGVKEEFKSSIFKPYFSKKVDGTGLGLSIVGEIVSDYDGTFEYYEDKHLSGAAFKITFKK